LSRGLSRARKDRVGTELLCEYLFRPLAQVVVDGLRSLRVPPPAVVLMSTAAGISAAVEVARGHLVVAALLLQAKTVLDNADGQLARATRRVTLLGRYLDSECDLAVNAAVFAGLGWYSGRPVAAAAGFLALTAVLSANFNAERLYRGEGVAPAAATGMTRALQRAYAVLYGWQDTLVERYVGWRLRGANDEARRAYHDRTTVSVLANLGLSTQLAILGACLALGHPSAFVLVVVAELALVVFLFARREGFLGTDREVLLDHR
jgi:archaetidylinositol phosphate synthase